MAFTLQGRPAETTIEFEVDADDGDINFSANGVELGYISSYDGKLHLFHLDEDEREALNGALSLSNGKLTVAE